MNKGLNFLNTTDWVYKEVPNQQYNVKVCPFCHNEKSKFYISHEGLWDCKVCQEAGNIYQLKAKLIGLEDQIANTKKQFENKKPLSIEDCNDFIADLWDNSTNSRKALKYLKSRGFTKETVEHFKIGLEDDWLMIPHFQDGKIWNYKKRNIKEKEFQRIPGQPSILFNIDNIDKEIKKLVIVEGEMDCMVTWQFGIKNVVGLTSGAGTFSPEWVSFTMKFDEIIICLDSDEPGQKGAFKIAEKVGISKCKNVILPTNDINDYLKEGHTAEDFKKILKNAKRFPVKNISHISDLLNNLKNWIENEGSVKGLEIPFQKTNEILKGFKDQDLIVLSGDTGVGKTTLCLNIAQHFLNNNLRVLSIFLEGKIYYNILRMMSISCGTETSILEKNEYELSKEQSEKRDKLIQKFHNYEYFTYTGPQAGMNAKNLLEIINLAVKIHDIDFVMIDNLQRFVEEDRYVTQNTSKAMNELKNLAIDLDIPILLITHITKPSDTERRKIIMHDAKQSSTIYQVADIYLTIWNNKDKNAKQKEMMLSIQKNRMGAGGDDICMSFLESSGIYEEDEERQKKQENKIKRKPKKEKITVENEVENKLFTQEGDDFY